MCCSLQELISFDETERNPLHSLNQSVIPIAVQIGLALLTKFNSSDLIDAGLTEFPNVVFRCWHNSKNVYASLAS